MFTLRLPRCSKLNHIPQVASRQPPNSPDTLSCYRWMNKLGRHSKILPRSLHCSNLRVVANPTFSDTGSIDFSATSVNDATMSPQQPHPVACGGFSDIYLGTMGTAEFVAIKVLRVFPTEGWSKKIFSVNMEHRPAEYVLTFAIRRTSAMRRYFGS